jgi:putative nucleotidyltransferase with HDIG domain
MLTKLDLSQCEKEAIHIPNLVQPHGFALVIEKSGLTVTRCSANLDSTSLGPAAGILGQTLQSVLPAAASAVVLQKLDFTQRKRHVIYGISIPSLSAFPVDVAVCDAHREIIVELLPRQADVVDEFVELQLNDMIPRVMTTQDSEDFFQRAAIELRALTGYDRVMVYRFDEDFNGQVIAESHEQGMESYLGLHYPASDIPVQARDLYRKNMIRTIVDVAYQPVAMISHESSPLDMSHSYLRSVSPIHLEYLKNMGVAATLTVSIIVENSLWGLVSCHHRTSYAPDLKRVGLAEVFGNIFGGMIQMREESERDRISGRMLSRLDTVMDIVMSQDKNQDVMDLIRERSFLFQSIFPSDGFLVRAEGQIVRHNFDLEEDLLASLLAGLAPLMRGSIFHTDHLAEVAPNLAEKTLRDCAGLMVLELNTRPASLWLWRRSEKTQTIVWGGDPNQKVILNQQGAISPRKSFEKYNQIVTGQSTRWNSAERDLPRYLIAQIYRLFEFFESSHQLEHQKKQIQIMEEEKAKHYQELIEMLVGVIEQRDAYTAGHTRRVADYCVAIARKLGVDERSVSTLREAAILHDIGKVIIPDSILLKPGRLSYKEYELIKAHLSVGYQILVRIDYYKPLAEIIRYHHEKFDGSGYPEGKKGEEISLLSHIMIVADAFDAMTTNRIYQARKTTDDAVAELISFRGKWYHPEVVDAAVAVAREMETMGTAPSQLPLTQMEKERFAYFFRDQLTGVYNGTYLWMVVNNLIPNQHCNFCLMIELHGMSEHNARFGWHEGNSVIRRFAEALIKTVREEQLFRVFGDDFVLCFDDQAAREAFLKSWEPLEIEAITATCRVVERTAFLEIL